MIFESRSIESRNRVLLGILLVILIVAFTLFVIFVFWPRPSLHDQTAVEPSAPPAQQHTAEQPPPESVSEPATWGSSYYYGGMPRPCGTFSDTLVVLTNTGYVVGYDETRRDPAWVCYRLHAVGNQHASPRPAEFMPDGRTRAQVLPQDYSRTGYDRGHMAPNHAIAVCYGMQAQVETFLMSNIIPQRPHLNREVWERLEREELDVYARRYRRIWVMAGPVFSNRALSGGEAIPSACYKILVEEDSGQPKVMAFLMPQDVTGAEQPEVYLTTVLDVEKLTGLRFFVDLPRDVRGRLAVEKKGWGLTGKAGDHPAPRTVRPGEPYNI